MKWRNALTALAVVVFVLFPAPAGAGDYSTFAIEGTVYFTYDYIEGTTPTNRTDLASIAVAQAATEKERRELSSYERTGCIVYVEQFRGNPKVDVVHLILIRSADGLACSRIYRTGRRIEIFGHFGRDFPEGTYFVWKSR